MTHPHPHGTARQRVLHHLAEAGHVSPSEARTVLGIERLAPRIQELRAEGYRIETEVAVDTRGRRYARYVASHSPSADGTTFFGSPLR
jgi:biotin operon repressor